MTHLSSYRPLLFKVRLALCSKSGTSLPGSNPVFTNTWNPLQIPIIGLPAATNAESCSLIAKRILLPRSRPEPRWSPKEKPPGTANMWNSERSLSPLTKWFTWTLSLVAPANSKTAAVSLSQLIPKPNKTATFGVSTITVHLQSYRGFLSKQKPCLQPVLRLLSRHHPKC